MRPERSLAVLLVAGAIAHCGRKSEIVPDGAKQVTRSDRSEESDAGEVKLREYRFVAGSHSFVCEARSFADDAAAGRAAAKAIAERPQENRQSARARFAVAGRSVWLHAGRDLTWCMLASGGTRDVTAAMAPVVASFRKLYEESP